MKTAFVVYGRMNPPTKGHEMLIRKAAQMASAARAPLLVYTTFTHGGNNNPRKKAATDGKNPLRPREKMTILHKMFKGNSLIKNLPKAPGARRGLSHLNVRTSKPTGAGAVRTRTAARSVSYPFRILYELKDKGYEKIVLVVGSDRVSQFTKMLSKLKYAEVRSAGERDPNSNNISGVSGTQARAAAVHGNLNKFVKTMSNRVPMENKIKTAKLIAKRTVLTPKARSIGAYKRPTPTARKSLPNRVQLTNVRSITDIFRKSL